jgi:hypothetical protein
MLGKILNLHQSLLKQMLKDNGPLWCAGYWFGVGHIIVLTGIVEDTVFFNDPDGGVKKTRSLTWFNEKIARDVSGHILCKFTYSRNSGLAADNLHLPADILERTPRRFGDQHHGKYGASHGYQRQDQ